MAVNVSPNFKSDYKLARNNLASLGELKIIPFVKIKLEPDPVLEMATENNRLMRTEAASISLFRFSFTQQIINSKQNIQHHKESKQYSSTRELK